MKAINRTPREMAQYLRNFINGGGGDWDWDDFESVPITDPQPERIRCEAARAAFPNTDIDRLAELLRETEALIWPKG